MLADDGDADDNGVDVEEGRTPDCDGDVDDMTVPSAVGEAPTAPDEGGMGDADISSALGDAVMDGDEVADGGSGDSDALGVGDGVGGTEDDGLGEGVGAPQSSPLVVQMPAVYFSAHFEPSSMGSRAFLSAGTFPDSSMAVSMQQPASPRRTQSISAPNTSAWLIPPKANRGV